MIKWKCLNLFFEESEQRVSGNAGVAPPCSTKSSDVQVSMANNRDKPSCSYEPTGTSHRKRASVVNNSPCDTGVRRSARLNSKAPSDDTMSSSQSRYNIFVRFLDILLCSLCRCFTLGVMRFSRPMGWTITPGLQAQVLILTGSP